VFFPDDLVPSTASLPRPALPPPHPTHWKGGEE
jgi:hypothetical protein